MRFVAFLLAITTFALSCMPCADGSCSLSTSKGKNTCISFPVEENHQDHKDACSPFCSCSCCAGFSMNFSVVTVSSKNILNVKDFASFLPATTIKIARSIWHPPQLA